MKQDLEYYYQSIFDEAERYSRLRVCFLFGILFLISLSVYAGERYLYFLALGIFVIQFSLWGLAQKITALYNLGNSFQKQLMLSDLSVKTMDVAMIENQKQKTSNYVRRKVEGKKEKHSRNAEIPKNKTVLHAAKLRRLIHENAYFNYHLFDKSYRRNLAILGACSAFILISILLFIPYVKVNSDLLPIRLVYSLLSLGLLYEFLTSTLRYRATTEDMKNIDSYLSQAPAAKESVLLEAFTRYSEAKALTPNIPNGVWEKNKDYLKEGWRSKQIQIISELCDKLYDVDEPWAITGGANHYIRGIVAELNDVDIITTERGGELISELLKECTAREYSFSECGTIKSYFCVLDYRSIQIEIMADPVNLIKGCWEDNNEWKCEIEDFFVNGHTLPLTTLEYEISIYRKLGNSERLKKLTAFKETKE
ncbi:hypothetical protein [Chromohalobacter sp. 11-W]|uniref:nucleotidyltransferase domain-containing protein n=1 Tax=Chromohalobacter sp. 11-W TaxID=2994061 RepID=UPI0024691640|nr:hypothetical protein [Chromohalobacter sp. 11-W]